MENAAPVETIEDVLERLTPLQARFVEEYLVDLNGTRAAQRAGSSANNLRTAGSEFLANPNVNAAVKYFMAQRSRVTLVDAVFVIERLKDVCERAMQAEPVLDREGNPTGDYVFNAAGANRALELLGRHIGIFDEGLRLKGFDGGPVKAEITHGMRAKEAADAWRAEQSKDD